MGVACGGEGGDNSHHNGVVQGQQTTLVHACSTATNGITFKRRLILSLFVPGSDLRPSCCQDMYGITFESVFFQIAQFFQHVPIFLCLCGTCCCGRRGCVLFDLTTTCYAQG